MLEDVGWSTLLSFASGSLSVVAAATALWYSKRAGDVAEASRERIQLLRERELRLEYLSAHPETVTEQDIRDLHLHPPAS